MYTPGGHTAESVRLLDLAFARGPAARSPHLEDNDLCWSFILFHFLYACGHINRAAFFDIGPSQESPPRGPPNCSWRDALMFDHAKQS